jgi:tol-pal system protein YbgF
METLERNIMLVQRQIARGGSSAEGASGGEVATASPQLQTQLDTIQEEIRSLRGKIEESQFHNRQNAEALEKLQKDVEYRLGALEAAKAEAEMKEEQEPAPVPVKKAPEPEAKATPKLEGKVSVKSVDEEASEKKTFANPREQYNDAFRLLNQTKYDEAAKAFKQFLKQNPKDPLVGNANYWLGEIHYMNHDFADAADQFRQGFESAPEGQKAPDNLLKLAMSLSALKHNKEACVVLRQVVSKFNKNTSNAVRKAENEQKRIGCQ